MVTLIETQVAVVSRGVAASSSLVCTLCFMIIEMYRGTLDTFGRRLIAALILSNMLLSGETLLEILVYPNYDCYAFGYVRNIAAIMATVYSVVVTVNVFLVVHRGHDLSKREKSVHACTLTAGMALASLPHIGKTFGTAGFVCWIVKAGIGGTWRWVSYYGPLWGAIFTVSVLFGKTTATMRTAQSRAVEQVKRRRASATGEASAPPSAQDKAAESSTAFAIKRMAFFPAIFIITFTFPTIHRVYGMTHATTPLWMNVVHGVSSQLQGLLNVAWFYSREIHATLEGHSNAGPKSRTRKPPSASQRHAQRTSISFSESHPSSRSKEPGPSMLTWEENPTLQAVEQDCVLPVGDHTASVPKV